MLRPLLAVLLRELENLAVVLPANFGAVALKAVMPDFVLGLHRLHQMARYLLGLIVGCFEVFLYIHPYRLCLIFNIYHL